MRFSLPGRSERRSVYSIDPPLAYPGLSVRIVAFAGDFLALVLLDVAAAIVVGFPIGLIFGLAAESIVFLELGLWLIARFSVLRVLGVFQLLRDAGRPCLPPAGVR